MSYTHALKEDDLYRLLIEKLNSILTSDAGKSSAIELLAKADIVKVFGIE